MQISNLKDMMNMSAGGKNETLEHLTRKLVEKVGPWEIQANNIKQE